MVLNKVNISPKKQPKPVASLIRRDPELDEALRPKNLDEFIGQESIKRNLNILLQAAKERGDVIEHVLFHGPSGLGKTSMAHIIARETEGDIRITSGPTLERVGDLASLLTNLKRGDVLFVDEIHRLNKTVEEALYSAMEEFVLDVIIGKGPAAQTLRINLDRFTLIGATTRIGMLSSPLRSRFGGLYHVTFYKPEEIAKVIERSAKLLGIKITPDATRLLAMASRSTPRVANRLLKRTRDYAQVLTKKRFISLEIAKETLSALGIDELGLEAMDRTFLQTLISKFGGGPTGIRTIAAAVGDEVENLEEFYEPYLIQLGFLERTPKGRRATERAYKHLEISVSKLEL